MSKEQETKAEQGELVYSFGIWRRATELLRLPERTKFNTKLPAYKLVGRRAVAPTVEIVSHYETGEFIEDLDDSNDFLYLNAQFVKSRIMNPGALTSKTKLIFPRKEVRYTQALQGESYQGQYKIQIVLDDKQALLEEERAVYLRNLAQLVGVQIPVQPYIPTITLGHTHNSVGNFPSDEALRALERLLPDNIELRRVRMDVVYAEEVDDETE